MLLLDILYKLFACLHSIGLAVCIYAERALKDRSAVFSVGW